MMGNAHPNLAPYAVFDCADGWIILATGNDAQYRRLCGILGLPGMAAAPEFATNADRIANRAAMTAAPDRRDPPAGRRPTSWPPARPKACPPARSTTWPRSSPTRRSSHRGMQIAADGLPGVRSPITFSGADLALDRPAPKLGEHQDEVLG